MTGRHPRLHGKPRRRKSGKVVVYYFYDRRPEGLPDISLGRDYEKALARWREIHEQAPRIAGTLQEAFTQWERDILPTHKPVTRRGYALNLKRLVPVFGPATWDQVDFPSLKRYLRERTAKTQANRELSLLQIVWNWARSEGLTALPWPAAGMERSKWKNTEAPRRFEVTDELFSAVYAQADEVLRDCMDIATATGMRLTDCLRVLLPRDDLLTFTASKTGKRAEFSVSASPVLSEVVTRRRTIPARHLMLLTTASGGKVSPTMLRDRYELARAAASKHAEAQDRPELAKAIRAMYLRDMRKRAADLAEDPTALLQHDDKRLTEKHYVSKPKRLKAAR